MQLEPRTWTDTDEAGCNCLGLIGRMLIFAT